MSRRRQLTRLTLWLQCLFAVTACADPERISVGLIGISSAPPLELSCIPKNLPSGTDICDLVRLSIKPSQSEPGIQLACGDRSVAYATSHRMVNLLRDKTEVTLQAQGSDANNQVNLECYVVETQQTQTFGIRPHN